MDGVCPNAVEAKKWANRCLQEGSVLITGHCRKALADDALTTQDALKVIQSGAIYDAPELDLKSGRWKFRIEGNCPAGIWLAVVFCFDGDLLLVLITAFAIAR